MELRTGHGRLLYVENSINDLNNWFDDLTKIDFFIEQGQNLSCAEDCCYLYFFSFDDSQNIFWCGRDVVGYESYLPDGLAFFDYYNGAMVEKEIEGPINSSESLINMAKSLKEEDPELCDTALTWRVRVSGIDHGKKTDKNSLIEMPKMTFQFFKIL